MPVKAVERTGVLLKRVGEPLVAARLVRAKVAGAGGPMTRNAVMTVAGLGAAEVEVPGVVEVLDPMRKTKVLPIAATDLIKAPLDAAKAWGPMMMAQEALPKVRAAKGPSGFPMTETKRRNSTTAKRMGLKAQIAAVAALVDAVIEATLADAP